MSRIGLVIFGATGFAGKYAVEQTVKIAKIKGGFTWGIAGRSKDKLQKLLEEVGKKYDTDLKDIPVLIADLSDQNSLNEMCSKASVIANCCGPYRFYGESVIKACINNKTHHVDISGEPEVIKFFVLLHSFLLFSEYYTLYFQLFFFSIWKGWS